MSKSSMVLKSFFLIVILLVSLGITSNGQSLHRDGQFIVDKNKNKVLLRSIGTGNWMIQEGYMMQSTGAGIHTHTQFRNKLNETMGVEKTDEFYSVWLNNHFKKADLDSMKSWGFNAVRPALHYKWFTLPIEEEKRNPDGTLENTWLEEGFALIDRLLQWCEQNEMYLILDMHGAPGGQGKNADISDYDETKPSLWESTDNQDKLVALWQKLAERYKNAEWIGGFDLINETNWNVDGTGNNNGCGCKNNTALWDLHERIIKAIRSVNRKHIVYISGNCWGNNYEGFDAHTLKDVDDNMVLTFHKYWNKNDEKSISEWLNIRQKYNLPVWMSEGGENSNHWFSEAIQLYEENEIGWSWWPVKKSRLNNVLKVTTDKAYLSLIESWKEGGTPLSPMQTYQAVLVYAEAHKIENCKVGKDVIYSMIDQGYGLETKAFKKHKFGEWIQCVDYDLGKDGYAYHDALSEDVHDGENKWAKWNLGNHYRNDGVDIGEHNDEYYVGWTEEDEWLQYTMHIEEEGEYVLELTSASKTGGSQLRIDINGITVLSNMQLPGTGDPLQWKVLNPGKTIFLPKGEIKLKIFHLKGGSNLKAFRFVKG